MASRRIAQLLLAAAVLLAACAKDDGARVPEPAPESASTESTTSTLGATTTEPVPPTSSAPAQPPPPLSWSRCGSNECATLQVPLDHGQPAGRKLDIAVNRRGAKKRSSRIGSLVFNPGGPGASGVDALGFVFGRLPSAVTDRFDIVGFDPRGVGRSSPISCLPDARLDAFFHVDPVPDDARERQDLVDVTKELIQGCEKASGDLLAHVGTADVAKDLDLLRAALGDEKLTYVGFSYGTQLGAVYANLFPGRVRALVLDGAVDPLETANESNRGQAKGFDSALEAFITDCRNKGTSCAWKPEGGPSKDAFNRLIAMVDANPIPTGSRVVGPAEATLGAAAALYDQGSWPALARGLNDAAARQGEILLRLFDSIVDRRTDGTYSNLQEVYVAVTCLDRPHPAGLEDVEKQAAAAAQESPAFGAAIVWSGLVCALWPVAAVPFPTATGPLPQVLVIGTTNDPATPYVSAQALSKQLGARLLTFKGEGHTAYGKDSCVNRLTDAYLLQLKLPAEGATC